MLVYLAVKNNAIQTDRFLINEINPYFEKENRNKKMKKNSYQELSDKELLNKSKLFKGVTIGFSVIYLFVITFIFYLHITKGLQDNTVVIMVPIFLLPTTLLPLLVNFVMLKKEMKSRQL